MTSKVLKMPEQAAVSRDYQSAMDRVRQGISANIWNHGTHAERLAFAEDCLAARIEGTKQHDRTGRPQYVPDLYEENGGLQWGLTMSSRESLQTAGPQMGGKDRQVLVMKRLPGVSVCPWRTMLISQRLQTRLWNVDFSLDLSAFFCYTDGRSFEMLINGGVLSWQRDVSVPAPSGRFRPNSRRRCRRAAKAAVHKQRMSQLYEAGVAVREDETRTQRMLNSVRRK